MTDQERKEDTADLLKRSLITIQQLRAKLDVLEEARHHQEQIAIVGMACRFPGGADTPESFWEMLAEGRDSLAKKEAYPIPPETEIRTYVPKGGTIPCAYFDAKFFGISDKEARYMDPQQRILLEVAWEALEDSGFNKSMLSGSKTGVFVGVANYNADYARLLFSSERNIDAFSGTGTSHSIVAGRLAYFLNLRGPNLVVDTACSSSLVAVHLACQSLRTGESNVAVAGGVNLILSPWFGIASSKMQLISPDARCKSFDASADGTVRSDGCGVVVLKRLSDAVRDGDRVLSVIKASAINQDGRSNGLTAPNAAAQVELIRDAMTKANIKPEQIQYIETHGTGTPLGDPIELQAISEILGKEERRFPCAIGAVKANLGHCEAAAGIAGIIKVVAALRHKKIPPLIHFHKLNPHCEIDAQKIRIPITLENWTCDDGEKRRAGVSAFGWSGTNVHIILEEFIPEDLKHDLPLSESEQLEILPISANCHESLRSRVEQVLSILQVATPLTKTELHDLCYTAAVRRTHHKLRAAFVGRNSKELLNKIKLWLKTGSDIELTKDKGKTALLDHKEAELHALAALYCRGDDIHWTEIFKNSGRVVSLPNYPWRKQRFWFDVAKQEEAVSSDVEVGQSLLTGKIRETPTERAIYEPTWTESTPILRHHIIYDSVVIPGAMHIAMALTACRRVIRQKCSLSNIAFVSPLIINNDEEHHLFFSIQDGLNNGDGYRYVLFARKTSGDQPWKLLSKGDVNFDSQGVASNAPIALEQLITTFGQPVSASGFYDFSKSLGLHLGASFTWMQTIQTRGDGKEVLCKLDCPEGTDLDDGLVVHPGFIDSCFQSLLAGLWAENKNPDLFIPLGIDALTWHSFPHGQLWCHSRCRESVVTGKETVVGDIDVYDTAGILVAQVAGLTVKRVTREVLNNQRTTTPSVFWKLKWTKDTSAAPTRDGGLQPDPWLLVTDSLRSGDALDPIAQEKGIKIHIFDMSSFQNDDTELLMTSLIKQLGALTTKYQNVLFVPSETSVICNGAAILDREVRATCCAIAITRWMSNMVSQGNPRLWILTAATQTVQPEDQTSSIFASLWGVGRTLKLEVPSIWGGLIDLSLPLSNANHDEVQTLIKTIEDSKNGACEIAIRASTTYTPEIAPLRLTHVVGDTPVAIEKDKTYLVIGGFGGIGWELTCRLVALGANSLVLVGRSLTNQKMLDKVSKWKQENIHITLFQGDMSDENTVNNLMLGIEKAGQGVSGVFYLAGSLYDSSIHTITASQCRRVMSAKIAGLWNLHEATKDKQLDFFVCFSSIAALLGNRGQAHYAAANAFMDAFSFERKDKGFPCVSIGWGPWKGEGMLAQMSEAHLLRMTQQGIRPMSVDHAMGELMSVLGSAVPQFIIGDIDWIAYKKASRDKRYAKEHETAAASEAVLDLPASRLLSIKSLSTAAAVERRGLIRGYVLALMQEALGVETVIESTQSLQALGVDSLVAVSLVEDIRGDFGKSVPITLFFDNDSVEEVVNYLDLHLSKVDV